MKRKYTALVITSFIFLFLVACNNGNNAMEGQQVRYGQISSDSTVMSSEEFPHTKAIQVQHAKYEFDVADEQEIQQSNTAQLTREDIVHLVPDDVARALPDGVTQEDIARLIPEVPEDIAQRLREVIPFQPGAPAPSVERQPEAAPEPEAPAEQQPEVVPEREAPAEQQPEVVPEREAPAEQQPEVVPEREAPAEQQPEVVPEPEAPAEQQPEVVPEREAPAEQQPEAAPEPEAPAQEQRERQEPEAQPEHAEGISEVEARVIELTNVERRRNGLPDLQADPSLSNVARAKSSDMQANNYFSHTSPTYGSPFDMMRDFDISYNAAGENIAQGQQTPEQVVQAWMNSEGHRANILNGNFTHIGVGYVQNGHYWTQMFISK